MDNLLALELEYTQKMIIDPSNTNRENLINVKKQIIGFLNETGDADIKKICNEYYDEHKKKLYEQYNYFANLREYLKKKQDVTDITNIIDSTLNEICS